MKKALLSLLLVLGLTSCEGFFEKPEEPKHEHQMVEGFQYDEVNHWQVCSSCDEKVNSTNHVFGDWVIVNEATENTNGLKRKTCACGYVLEEVIDVLGHTHNSSNEWSKNDQEHWHTCRGCSELLDKAPHSFVEGICECGYEEVSSHADDAYIVGYGSYTTADWSNEGGVKFNVLNDEPNALAKYSVTLDLAKGDCLMFKVLAEDGDKWYGYTFIKGITVKAGNPTNYDGSFLSSVGDNNINCDVKGNYTFYLIIWEGYAADVYVEVNSFELEAEKVYDDAYLIGTGSYLTGEKLEWNNESGVKLPVVTDEPSALEKYAVNLDLQKDDVLMVHIMSNPERWYGYTFIRNIILKAENPTNYEGDFLVTYGDSNIKCEVSGNYTFYVVVWQNYSVDIYVEVNSFTLPEVHEHTFSEKWSNDENNHWHQCDCGDKTNLEAHKGGTATTTEQAVCEVCNTPYGALITETIYTFVLNEVTYQMEINPNNPNEYMYKGLKVDSNQIISFKLNGNSINVSAKDGADATNNDEGIEISKKGTADLYLDIQESLLWIQIMPDVIDYYLKGSMNGWVANDAYQFTDGVLETTLYRGMEFKVSEYEWNDTTTLGFDKLVSNANFMESYGNIKTIVSGIYGLKAVNGSLTITLVEAINDKYTITVNDTVYTPEINTGNTNNEEWAVYGIEVKANDQIVVKNNDYVIVNIGVDGSEANGIQGTVNDGFTIKKDGKADFYLGSYADCGYSIWVNITVPVTYDDAYVIGYGSYTTADWSNEGGVKMELFNDNEYALEKYKVTLDLKTGDCILFHLMANTEYWFGYSSINDSCASKTTNLKVESEGSNNIVVLVDGTYTVYFTVWTNYTAELWFEYQAPAISEDAYIVGTGSYLTGEKWEWQNECGVKLNKHEEKESTEYAKYSVTVELKAGDVFGIRYMASNAEGGVWYGSDVLNSGCDISASINKGGNFEVLADGSYTIYLTIWNNDTHAAEIWINKN